MSPDAPPTPPAIASQRQLAKALGRSEGAVRKWLGRDDWPASVPRTAPWTGAHAAAIADWLSLLQENRAAPDGEPTPAAAAPAGTGDATSRSTAPLTLGGSILRPKDETQTQLRKVRIQKLEAEVAILRGQKIDRSLLDQALESLARAFVRELDDLAEALPHLVAGLDAGQVEKHVKDRVRAIRKRLADTATLELGKVKASADGGGRKKRSRGEVKAAAAAQSMPS